jgi:predicted DNA-binding transcriptional regulator AlpA
MEDYPLDLVVKSLVKPLVRQYVNEELKAKEIDDIEFGKHSIMTTADLIVEFQVSKGTLWKFQQLESFPKKWNGIQGRYLRSEIEEWLKSDHAREYQILDAALRSAS